jgi:Common central domain of tyrosinase
MTPSRFFLTAATVLSSFAAAVPAMAAACPGGGSLTITASADSLTLAPVAATTFNFGEHVILTATASGFSITGYSWSIDAPTIKDYNEDLGTKNSPTPGAAVPWNTTQLAPSDLTAASVSFYWVPTAAQFEPNNGPFPRNVSLTANMSVGGSCTASTTYMVERNETDITRQAEDFYTSNHRAATTTNPGFGHVVDEHIFWHASVHDLASFPVWTRFLAWHGEFVRRFDLWRHEFGYNNVVPWYPGRPLPTGPQFDVNPILRLSPYVPGDNEIPTYYTITGGAVNDPNISGTHKKLADYASLDAFTGSFEGSYHGQVHCAIGTSAGFPENFFETSGAHFGTMCFASSPKDPMFWRWHGFIDLMYRNYCALQPAACASPSPPDPAADPWMADNAMDVTNNGTVPSPGTHWISPDVWNRRVQVTTDACVGPVDSYGDHVTTGGVVRNCGTSADHENPVTGVTNYLYGTLRNTRPNPPRVVYAEVGVYYALASTGLHYPTDFHQITAQTPLFVAVFLESGDTTSIGPIPWTPPALPPANDHYCLYLRVLSVQATPPVEGAGIDTDVANNNNLAWRNIKVVAPGDTSPPSFFIVRNIGREAEPLTLRFEVPEQLMKPAGTVRIKLDEALSNAFDIGQGTMTGLAFDGKRNIVMTSPKAEITGLKLAPRAEGHVAVQLGPTKPTVAGDITIIQTSRAGIDGGVTIHLAKKKR